MLVGIIVPALLLSIHAATALVAPRQSRPSLSVRPFWPDGSAEDFNGSLDSTIPFPCAEPCQTVFGSYFYCFINTTRPFGNGVTTNQQTCNSYLCPRYDLLTTCLNCVVANGDERPSGYQLNTSLTAPATRIANGQVPVNPEGLIDADQANGWLRNVSERCASIGSTVSGETTVTAVPTTTGPHYTTWTQGQTVSLSEWTGLVTFTNTGPVSASAASVTGADATVTSTGGAGVSSTPATSPTTGSSTSVGLRRMGRSDLVWLGGVLACSFLIL
ncbi:hypothetical protein IAR55_002609 [Kwoniella newhampshirensis]|uniref:Uncharacterized protein n=1 Tax=Kwoniella newhampshirensis TaxID=1651941 RepID=A0AAW0YN74_9TREE